MEAAASQGGWVYSIVILHHCEVRDRLRLHQFSHWKSISSPNCDHPCSRRRSPPPPLWTRACGTIESTCSGPPGLPGDATAPTPPPPTASTQRLIKVVPRKPGSRLSFCQLDGEGGGEVECEEDRDSPPYPPPASPPCVSYCNTAKDHCANCGMCIGLCPDQSGWYLLLLQQCSTHVGINIHTTSWPSSTRVARRVLPDRLHNGAQPGEFGRLVARLQSFRELQC